MKVLVLISLVGGLMLSSCGGSSSKNNASGKEVNPADTIYLGDLREKFADDSIFFKVVAPDLMLMDYQYLWAVTESEAVEKGLTKEYYKRVKKEITDTNEAIKRGVKQGIFRDDVNFAIINLLVREQIRLSWMGWMKMPLQIYRLIPMQVK